MKDLRPCESCSRHVFATERTCPFCQAVLEPAPERTAVAVPSSASRAQRLALAAAIGSQSLLACAETVDTGGPLAGTGAIVTAGTSAPLPVPVYGVPLAGQPAPAAGRGGVISPAYGAPLAGQPAPTAGRGGVPQPVYGAPAPDDAGTAPDEDAGDLD